MQDRDVPLCVDLDGTLIHSDLLAESAFALLRRNPLYLVCFVFWLARGRARLKREIAARVTLDVTRLPYDRRVLAWLDEQADGRRRVLCTASDAQLASAVAAHLGRFDETFGSDGVRNLGGRHKRALLSERFGRGGFDYVGNARTDLVVWAHARRAIVANAPAGVVRAAHATCEVERVFERRGGAWRAWLAALRLHQWAKNLLVFVPLVAAHVVFVPDLALRTLVAFLAFGLCASGAYVVNDLFDLDADRRHPRKQHRPFAAGRLPLAAGLVAAPLLTAAAFAVAFALSPGFALVLAIYAVTTLAYSLAFKRVAMLDVVVLAGLYTVRIFGGAVAIAVPVSSWLLAFAMFLFLSLAMVKRYTEVRRVAASEETQVAGRGYGVGDLGLIQSLGTTSGYLSAFVLALYVDSTKAEALYRHHAVLWLLVPMLLYWIGRVWLLAGRGHLHDDPVVFALTDKVSLGVLAAFVAVVALAAA
ncbi:MAG: UbiA family prenyltransferase [Rhodanobacteraceae bacterium]|jgi:4-hydroxybenzoate polyprenyltransferase|nr:UbiA family prenyltransferase [Rhodanobacteraceae bacterium]